MATSAIEAPAITTWPNFDSISPASLSSGSSTASEVADRITAIRNGELITPAPESA